MTYLAVQVYDVGMEINPLFVKPLNEGALIFALAHVYLFAAVAIVFIGFLWLFELADSSERDWLRRFSTVAWSLIILCGLVLVGNNLFVLSQAFR